MERQTLSKILGTAALATYASAAATPIVGLVGGAYLGYCNGKGSPTNHEFALKYGSAILGGATGVSYSSLLRVTGAIPTNQVTDSLVKSIGSGVGVGGLTTLLGYCAGYAVASGGF